MKDLLTLMNELVKASATAFANLKEEQEQHEKALEEHREHSKKWTAVAMRKEAEQIRIEHNTNIGAIKNTVFERIESIRKEYEKIVKEEYMPQGSALDTDAVALLQSGIVLTEAEVELLVDKHIDNSTMLRVIEKYVNDNKISVSSALRSAFLRAKNGYEFAMNAYDSFSYKVKNLLELMKHNAPYNDIFTKCNEKLDQYIDEYEKQIKKGVEER